MRWRVDWATEEEGRFFLIVIGEGDTSVFLRGG